MRFFFILVLSLSNSWLLGQENTINLSIKISDDSTGLGLEGATVKILQDMKTYASRKTDSSGRVSFEGLPIQHVYWISLEKEGFVTKCISMNAHSDFPEDLPMLYKQPMETGLFRPLPHEDFAFLKEEPMVKFSFDQAGILTWDKRSLMEMQKKIARCKDGLKATDILKYNELLRKAREVEESDPEEAERLRMEAESLKK